MAITAARAERMQLVWPTPNTGWADRKPLETYLQHAGSGDPESGSFGSVRSGGHQFHEGLDIKCVSRDRRGEVFRGFAFADAFGMRRTDGVVG